MPNPPLILASASPRRRELLRQIGLEFEVQAADVDESRVPEERPQAYVQRLAKDKAFAIAQSSASSWVLGADTVVVIDGEVLGKPRDDAQALAMLAALSGRTHRVLTAVCLAAPEAKDSATRLVSTDVHFVRADLPTLEGYVRTQEGRDKAGAYAIQGIGAALVRSIEGSYSNVVGLPLAETLGLLRRYGVVESWP